MNVLLDINIILDVLQKRGDYYIDSARVMSLCANNVINGYLSSISFGTIHYILSKSIGKNKSLTYLKKIRAFTLVALVDTEAIDLALTSNLADLEDALQYYSAIRSGINYIITRNKKDFPKSELSVVTPREFLTLI
ncbi:MAG: PIN domain-containing protein [bacterium]